MSKPDIFTATYDKSWVDPLRCRCGHRLVLGERMVVESPTDGYGKTVILGCSACRPGGQLDEGQSPTAAPTGDLQAQA